MRWQWLSARLARLCAADPQSGLTIKQAPPSRTIRCGSLGDNYNRMIILDQRFSKLLRPKGQTLNLIKLLCKKNLSFRRVLCLCSHKDQRHCMMCAGKQTRVHLNNFEQRLCNLTHRLKGMRGSVLCFSAQEKNTAYHLIILLLGNRAVLLLAMHLIKHLSKLQMIGAMNHQSQTLLSQQ